MDQSVARNTVAVVGIVIVGFNYSIIPAFTIVADIYSLYTQSYYESQ